jgi:hypothetical protein
MSIKALVKEYVRIEEAEKKIRQRKYNLKDKILKTKSCIEIIDGVVWKLGWYHGDFVITKVGEVNEKA